MKELLYKERKLAASPLSYFFVLFALMTLIPGYPILVGALFVCLGLFYSFQNARECGDILYTVLLPVKKTDAVRAKYAFCCRLQLLSLALMAALTALRMTLLADKSIYTENVMMPANPAFLGFALLIFAAFNTVFLGGFFKTAYGIGKPFIAFIAAALLLVGVGETLHHLPPLAVLKGTDLRSLLIQCIVLAAGAALYALLTASSQKKSVRRFEALDF